MNKRDLAFLRDMHIHAQKASELSAGISRAQFNDDELLQYGLAYLLQTIGEAANHVSDETTEKLSEID